MSNTTVVFTEAGAKVLHNYKPFPFYNKQKVLVNPSLGHLENINPMFWKLHENQIKEMTRPEKLKMIEASKKILKHKSHREIIYPFIKGKVAVVIYVVLIHTVVYFLAR